MARTYLDYNATAPPREEALAIQTEVARDLWGNASSAYLEGRRAQHVLEHARERVADALGAHPAEIVFTASGTEADNLALAGSLAARTDARNGVLISTIEHSAVHEPGLALEAARDADVRWIACGADGRHAPDDFARELTDTTALVCLMHANNETGVVQPVREVARAARAAGARVHCDAVQSLGKIPVHVDELGCDLLAISAHKVGGPKGVGALFVRRGIPLAPIVRGGPQERERRGGTENVPAIAAAAAAVALAVIEQPEEAERLDALRLRLCEELQSTVAGVAINGRSDVCLPNTINLSVDGVDGTDVMVALDIDGIAVSTGAACAVGTVEPSRVLSAMGLDEPRVRGAIRISMGRLTTGHDIDCFLEIFPRVVQRLRAEV